MSIAGLLTIDLGAIARNWRALDAMSPPETETAAVLKADAYGCGADRVGPVLAEAGVRTFFVAMPSEGAALRQAVGEGPAIYVLAGYDRGDLQTLTDHDIRPVLNSARQAAHWFEDRPGGASALQLDSGMNRLGMEEAEVPPLPHDGSIRLVMSHLACADESDSQLNRAQLMEFSRVASELEVSATLSLSATGGILLGEDWHFGMCRAGIGLYGGQPFDGAAQVVTLEVPVIQIRDVQPGEVVGYGAAWVAERPSRVATLSAGYADGLIRAMGNRAQVWHDGRPVPVVGRVSMDLITIDVTDRPDIGPGDPLELLGPHQTVDGLAEAAGTIGYEILTSLGSRYQRRYCG